MHLPALAREGRLCFLESFLSCKFEALMSRRRSHYVGSLVDNVSLLHLETAALLKGELSLL